MPIGVAVASGGASALRNQARSDLVKQHFSQITAENDIKMNSMQPNQNQFNFGPGDDLVGYAKANGLTVHGHTLLWHNQLSQWMKGFSGNRNQWIAMMESHVEGVATHFDEGGSDDTVTSWDVVNEAFNEDGSYRGTGPTLTNDGSIWYKNIGSEYIELAF